MSRLYGNAVQLGYLVDALEPAMRHWSEMLGIGPFFVMPQPDFVWLNHRGDMSADGRIIAEVALAQSGDMQIELIVPGPAPSTYREFLNSGRTGLHHIGMASHDFDRQRTAALASGMTIVTEGASTRTRFAYLEGGPDTPGPVIELIEMSPIMVQIFDRVRAASIGWRGDAPIRPL